MHQTNDLEKAPAAANKCASWRARSIDVLGLSARSHHPLFRAGINTLGLLSDWLDADPRYHVRKIGVKSHSEISAKLHSYVAALGPDLGDVEPDDECAQIVQHVAAETTADKLTPYFDASGTALPDDATGQLRSTWHSYSILALDLPTRILRALQHGGCQTLGQLVELAQNRNPADAHITGLGPKSLMVVNDKLSAYLQGLSESASESVSENSLKPPAFASAASTRAGDGAENSFQTAFQTVRAPGEGTADAPLPDRIARWLAALPARDYQVISWRYGLAGELLTLDAAGQKLGLTRERIRQIEIKAILRLKRPRHDNLAESVMMIIAPAFEQADGLMSDDEIAAVASRFAPEGVDGLGLMRLLSKVLEKYARYDRARVWAQGVDIDLVLDVQSKITEALKAARRSTKAASLVSRLQQNRRYRGRPGISQAFLRACLRTHPALKQYGDEWVGLASWAGRKLEAIIRALRQTGQPAHYKEITETVNRLLPEDMQTTRNNLYARLQSRPEIFVRVGQGIYGLVEWGEA